MLFRSLYRYKRTWFRRLWNYSKIKKLEHQLLVLEVSQVCDEIENTLCLILNEMKNEQASS